MRRLRRSKLMRRALITGNLATSALLRGARLKRREFNSLVGSVGVLFLTKSAPLAQTSRKIGCLRSGLDPALFPLSNTRSPTGTLMSMRRVWQRLGYIEGESVILRGTGGDPQRLPELVADLINLKVGVLVVVGPAVIILSARIAARGK